MDPPLKGLFFSSDYDLLLVLDSDHFLRNQEQLNLLRVGSDIKFKGFLRSMGKVGEHYSRGNNVNRFKDGDDGELIMPLFSVFDIEIVRQIDELPTDGYNRNSHHHFHKNMRYDVKKD